MNSQIRFALSTMTMLVGVALLASCLCLIPPEPSLSPRQAVPVPEGVRYETAVAIDGNTPRLIAATTPDGSAIDASISLAEFNDNPQEISQ